MDTTKMDDEARTRHPITYGTHMETLWHEVEIPLCAISHFFVFVFSFRFATSTRLACLRTDMVCLFSSTFEISFPDLST